MDFTSIPNNASFIDDVRDSFVKSRIADIRHRLVAVISVFFSSLEFYPTQLQLMKFLFLPYPYLHALNELILINS